MVRNGFLLRLLFPLLLYFDQANDDTLTVPIPDLHAVDWRQTLIELVSLHW
jgi:hypothetical protein